MSYKFLKISSIYDPFLRKMYTENLALQDHSYDFQYKFLMDQFFGWADSYEFYLEKLYGYETCQIIANAQTLQNTWAKENNLKNHNNILLEQIKKFSPEIIFIQDPNHISLDILLSIKKDLQSVKLIITYQCSPVTDNISKMLNYCDIVLTCTHGFKNYFEQNNLKSELLAHAFDERILKKIKQDKNNDIVFIGSIVQKDNFHNKRKEFIDYLTTSHIPIQLYSESLNNAHYGLDYFNLLSSACIGLNNHIDVAGNYGGNMRLFETTGVGTCLVTDYKVNMENFFEIDTEIICYKSFDEAVEKITWLTRDRQACDNIAKKGQLKTLTNYNYERRAGELNSIINKYIR